MNGRGERRSLQSSSSRDSQDACAFDFVVLQHLEGDVCFGEAEGHRADSNWNLGRQLQELLAVGARVSCDAAKLFFVEEMFLVVEHRDWTQINSSHCEDA